MFANLTGWHALIILAVIVLLFGATKLPVLAKSVGQSMKIFKAEVKSGKEEEAVVVPSAAAPSAASASSVADPTAAPTANASAEHLSKP